MTDQINLFLEHLVTKRRIERSVCGWRWVVAAQMCAINLGSSVKPQTQIYLHENCTLYSLSSFPSSVFTILLFLFCIRGSNSAVGALQVLLNSLGMELCRDDLR